MVQGQRKGFGASVSREQCIVVYRVLGFRRQTYPIVYIIRYLVLLVKSNEVVVVERESRVRHRPT